jgi:predicted lipoprotein with Yx(FWY)xxD motif
MKHTKTYLSLAALVAAIALIAAACGGGSDQASQAPAQTGSAATATVSVSTIDGVGDVLVDTQGAALYASEEEAGGMVVCVDGCTTIWEPLTLSGDAEPTAPESLAADLGVLERPDGTRQVTLDGRPLYRFTEDPGPGTVTGNGFADTFDGQAFTWHVATPTGVSTTSTNSAPSSDDPYGA